MTETELSRLCRELASDLAPCDESTLAETALGGELTPEQAAHLDSCDTCRDDFEALRYEFERVTTTDIWRAQEALTESMVWELDQSFDDLREKLSAPGRIPAVGAAAGTETPRHDGSATHGLNRWAIFENSQGWRVQFTLAFPLRLGVLDAGRLQEVSLMGFDGQYHGTHRITPHAAPRIVPLGSMGRAPADQATDR